MLCSCLDIKVGVIFMIKETPRNIEELKKKANNKNSWRERLSAVNVLKEYDCKQSKDPRLQ